ncbi:unnamed protein product, partial [Cyprideis torosa]
MLVLGALFALGGDLQKGAAVLAGAKGAPGRLERIVLDGQGEPGGSFFVDYAHTPDALYHVLATLKKLPHERIVCVFGCGGDRDKSKRPEMGKIAASLADLVVVTTDNPRTEDPGAILDQIAAGVESQNLAKKGDDWLWHGGVKNGYVVIAERREAIRKAVWAAGEDDIVLIAGKGHEKYQIVGRQRRFFDDSLEVKEALAGWNLGSLENALGVRPSGGLSASRFSGVSTDTRTLVPGEIFVALRGDTFDGHDHLAAAMDRGALALVVQRGSEVPLYGGAVFEVDDTLEALGKLAASRRKNLAELGPLLVVGITGSTGKTTVKEMVAAIFSVHYPDVPSSPVGRVLKTRGNFNNLVGLPLSLLPLELKHRVAVLEMGMNQKGEMARLATMADPDISCIVNVHDAHLEGLGNRAGVAREKGQLFGKTKENGVLVVNLDDEH